MERLILIHWNKSTGPIPIIQYPPEGVFPSKEIFLKIWAQHELDKENNLRELDFILEGKDRSVISVTQEFKGEIYFLVLIITTKSKVSDLISSDILAVITKNLLELINTDKITRAVSEAFSTIKNYTKLEGQNLISFFHERIKFTILQILRNGVITKNDLVEILRNDYGFSTVNIDLLLISFLQEKLIRKKSLPGTKECYFLINDLSYMRIPSLRLPDDTIEEKITKKFKTEIIKFYGSYNCSQEIENKLILSLLIDTSVRNLIKALRKSELTVNESLNLLNNREDLFDELLEKKIIFEAKGIVFLFTDIRFVKFTPLYLIKILPDRYKKGEISMDQYLYHIKLLINPLKEKSSILDYSIV